MFYASQLELIRTLKQCENVLIVPSRLVLANNDVHVLPSNDSCSSVK